VTLFLWPITQLPGVGRGVPGSHWRYAEEAK